MTCATCHKEITLNSFFKFEKYFCSKKCRDEHCATKGFETVKEREVISNCDYCQGTGYVPYPYFPPPWTDYNGTGMPCCKCQPEPESPCEGKPYPPTHTVELTEEDIDRLLRIAGELYLTGSAEYKALYAKLRPKKESVEFRIGDVNVWLERDVMYLRTSENEIWFNYKGFDELVAKVHARKGEVKDAR